MVNIIKLYRMNYEVTSMDNMLESKVYLVNKLNNFVINVRRLRTGRKNKYKKEMCQ